MTAKPKLKLVAGGINVADALKVADALNDQIQFARGLALAVLGEGELHGFDSSPLSQLVETHIEQLEAIARDLKGGVS